MHRITIALFCTGVVALAAQGAEHRMARYNVVWHTPSKDATGQMPLGNGDIAEEIYAIENGDLYLLLAKNDAYTYNGDIFKTGRVRLSLEPNPFAKGKPFQQTLDLPTGSIRIEADGVKLLIWADANRPVYHVQIDSPEEISVTASPDLWERFDTCRYNQSAEPMDPPTQDVRLERNGHIITYYAVGNRSVFPTEMKYYDVEYLIGTFPDPYRHNTFGNLLESPDLELQDGELRGKGNSFDIRIHALCKQEPEISKWVETIEAQANQPIDVEEDWASHCRWWTDFWGRSWIVVSDNTLPEEEREVLSGEGYTRTRPDKDRGALVAQSYNVFRFLMACQSRGKVQAKFNGGLFTQPLLYKAKSQVGRGMHAVEQPNGTWFSHEDEREWGRRFTFQNQRLLYWPLLMSGDFDLMRPFFNYYWHLLPVRKAVTSAWFEHDGAYYRENIEPTGGERDCGRTGKPLKVGPGGNRGQGYYHSFYFTSGLETLAMMIDYVKYTGDVDFRDRVVVPFAREVLLFFDKHYPRDANGKLRIDPGMVLETWWISVNSAPDVSGLRFCLDELLGMEAGTVDDRRNWRRFRAEVPPIHLHEIDGRKAIAPALEWAKKHNAENGELYPVFPFRCFGLGLGTRHLVEWTMQHRTNKNAFGCKCWTQDQIHWAYAGNAAEAQNGLVTRFRHASDQCRFPLYGSRGPDSCPDLDHFGAGSTALQRMLVQEAAGKTLLLPAWPADWDVDFKLHLTGGGVIHGKVIDGSLAEWSIEPVSREQGVVVYEPASTPVIPANDYPLRIGADQRGDNRFRGEIGRVTMFRGRLDPEAIRTLAAGDRKQKLADGPVLRCVLDPKTDDALAIEAEDLASAVSLEAWIRPEEGESGRILDKLTGGQRDGFLLDCWPKLSLRLIVGSRQLDFPNVLQPGAWQHVAVVIERGDLLVYLDGRPASGDP